MRWLLCALVLFVSCSIVAPGSASADEPPTVTVEIQIDSPFSPFKTKQEARRYALKNDHTGGQLNPLPELWVQVNGKDAWKATLLAQGKPMTHVHYGRGQVELPADATKLVVRVRIETQGIDESQTLSLHKGRFLVLSQRRDKQVVIKQYTTRPLYR